MRKLLIFFFLFSASALRAQQLPDLDSLGMMLLPSQAIALEATFGLDNMYNFRFDVAESQYRWLQSKYPAHPLSYFLLGLSNWWKIMPDIDNTRYDLVFLAYMDSSIYYSEKLYKADKRNIEAAFFLAASHAFKGRLYAERGKWRKAATEGKRSLDFLEVCKGKGYLSPELLFGDGIYNYFSVWIPQNYPALKPIMLVFPKGDKALGIKQLEESSQNAFYTRIESSIFLMRLYAIEEKKPEHAFLIAEYLYKAYPNNPYFHRFYTRMLFSTGKIHLLRKESASILARIDSAQLGYEATSGRYAAYYMGYLEEAQGRMDIAKIYYELAVEYSEKGKAMESGYYHASLFALAEYYEKKGRYDDAKAYYDKLLEHADTKQSQRYYDEAKGFKRDYKKWKKGKK